MIAVQVGDGPPRGSEFWISPGYKIWLFGTYRESEMRVDRGGQSFLHVYADLTMESDLTAILAELAAQRSSIRPCSIQVCYSPGQFLITDQAYAFTPTFRRIVIIGHQSVKADWKRLSPTNAVKRNQ